MLDDELETLNRRVYFWLHHQVRDHAEYEAAQPLVDVLWNSVMPDENKVVHHDCCGYDLHDLEDEGLHEDAHVVRPRLIFLYFLDL